MTILICRSAGAPTSVKRTIYLCIDVECGKDFDPMQGVDDIATWAELKLNDKNIRCDVTAFATKDSLLHHIK